MTGGGRVECVVCGIGFPREDLFRGEGGWVCARCFALQGPVTRDPGSQPVGSGADADGTAEPVGGSVVAGERVPAAEAGAPVVRTRPAIEPAGPAVGLDRLGAAVREWAAGRSWWIRAPVLLWMAWILAHYWGAPSYSTLWKGLDLVIHEAGHVLWSPLGEFLGFAGGTLTQLLVPVAAGLVLYRQRDWFGISVAICWLGINCFEIAEYAGDALTRQLPLVSPTSGAPEHDWTYMLARLGILYHTDAVAAVWQWGGRLVMSAGVVLGGWVVWVMGTGARENAGYQEATR